MITKIIDDLGLDMYDRPETTAMNLKLIDDLLEYMLPVSVVDFDNLEFVFSDEYDRFYRDEAMEHTVVDEFADICIVRLGSE